MWTMKFQKVIQRCGVLGGGKTIKIYNQQSTFSTNKNTCADTNGGKSPLEGIRVVDLTRILAGPYCSMILGDLGAEIIKVEKPGLGDDTRSWGPPFVHELSCYTVSVNRNKKSVALDLKKGKQLLKDLVKKSDILIENFVPGTLDNIGLGYEVLREINPRLIFCSITGFGPDGPYAQRGGYDVIAASIGGLLHITGPKDGEPCKVGVAMTDLATGLYAHGAIMAALYQRTTTDKGQRIDCNLLSTQIASLANLGSSYLNAGIEAKRWGTAHETIVPYEAFKTKDGRWITIGAGNNELFTALCNQMNLPELASDERYASNALRTKNRIQLIAVIKNKILEKDCEEWLKIFEGCRFPYGPVNDMKHAFHDPQVQHNEMVRTLGAYKVVGPAVKYSGSTNAPRSPPPTLGQHTREVLRDILNLSEEEIDHLFRQNVIQ